MCIVCCNYDIKGKVVSKYNPNPYKITKCNGSMITAENGHHTITRNASFFRPIAINKSVSENQDNDNDEENQDNDNDDLT